MILLAIGSIYGALRVFGAELDPSLMTSSLHTGSELSGHAIVTPGVRSLTPFFNLYGTVTLVGGARLFSLAVLAQTRAAPPGDRKCVDRFCSDLAGIWRDL